MNSTPLTIFGLILVATIISVASLYEKSATASTEQTVGRCPASIPDEKVIIGHSEVVYLGDSKELMFDAKVDSGAQTSSIHATDITTFMRKVVENGEEKELLFVKFSTQDDLGNVKQLERMVSRIDQVKSASGISTRYFFVEKVWVHQESFEIEINLADRSSLTKKMLIGKNLLEQGYLIDTTRSYVITDSIKPVEKL